MELIKPFIRDRNHYRNLSGSFFNFLHASIYYTDVNFHIFSIYNTDGPYRLLNCSTCIQFYNFHIHIITYFINYYTLLITRNYAIFYSQLKTF